MTATGIAIVIDTAKETASQTVTKIVTETRIGEAVATGASTHEETETETEGTEALNHAGTGEIEVWTLEEIAGTEVAVAVDGAIVSCAGPHFIG